MSITGENSARDSRLFSFRSPNQSSAPRIAQIFSNQGAIAATAPPAIASRNAVAENAIRLTGLLVGGVEGAKTGEVSVESKLGKGSTFKVALPLGSAHLPKVPLDDCAPLLAPAVQDSSRAGSHRC